MDYLDIRFALAKKGYTLRKLAKELGRHATSVGDVVRRKYISARTEQRISEITGFPLEKLFPDRYKRPNLRAGAGVESPKIEAVGLVGKMKNR